MNGAGFVHAPTTKSGGLMLRCHNHAGFTAGALLAASIAVAATASSAMPRYDGLWSVSIVTTKGDCIASYRYPMRIVGGVLANGGDIAINVSGKVRPMAPSSSSSAAATPTPRAPAGSPPMPARAHGRRARAPVCGPPSGARKVSFERTNRHGRA
jgi:hypothetical protein